MKWLEERDFPRGIIAGLPPPYVAGDSSVEMDAERVKQVGRIVLREELLPRRSDEDDPGRVLQVPLERRPAAGLRAGDSGDRKSVV